MRVPGVPYIQGENDYADRDDRKYGMAIHNTSNDATDTEEANYATRRPDGVSSHFYVDKDSVTQSLDTDDKAGHAGSGTGNENSIAWEFTGGNGMSQKWWLENIAWDKVGEVMAYLIQNDQDFEGFEVRRASVREMQINPRVKAFYGHDDMRRAWGGTDHTDPGPNFPWDKLFDSVNKYLEEDDVALTDEEIEKIAKRVWARVNPSVNESYSAILRGTGKAVVNLSAQVAGMVELVQQALTAPPSPVTDAQLADLTRAVTDAAREGAEEAHAVSTGEAEPVEDGGS